MPIGFSGSMSTQNAGQQEEQTHEQMEITVFIIGDDVALYVHWQHILDEKTEGALRLPQCAEGWDLETPAGQSQFDYTSWADRAELDGDPCRQFLESEDTDCHVCIDDTTAFVPCGRNGLLLLLFLLFLLFLLRGRSWLTFVRHVPHISSPGWPLNYHTAS